MTDKEEKAIEKLKYVNIQYDCNNYHSRYELDCIETVLNLIEKQKLDLEEQEKINHHLQGQLDEEIARMINIRKHLKEVQNMYGEEILKLRLENEQLKQQLESEK
jgi:capsule polysaccharide export protein KpsE/RkpR